MQRNQWGKKKYNENLSAKFIFHSTIDQFDHIFILFPLQVVPDWPRYQVSQATFKFPYATISGHWHNEKETWPTKNRVPRGEDKGRRGEEGKKFFPTIQDGGRQKEKNGERWTERRRSVESSKIRWSEANSDVVYERVENGGHGRVCLRVLARLNAASSPLLPPVATVCSFDSFQSLHRHRRPLSPPFLYLLPPLSYPLREG